MPHLDHRRSWLRVALALWLATVTLLQVVPTAVASVPAQDGPVPALQVDPGPHGPGSLMEEPEALTLYPAPEPVTLALLPPPSALEPTPVRALVPPGSIQRLDRPPTP